jgi:hypothetical protein
MRASTSDYSKPTPTTDRVVTSIDGFNSYLLVVDKFSRYMWIFLCKSKEPPIDEMSAFLSTFGLQEGGVIRCDQGGELAGSEEFITSMLKHHNIKWSPREQTRHRRMVEWSDLIKRLEPLLVVYYTALPYPQSSGHLQWSMQSTSTTGWSTAELNAHRMRPLQINNQM